ncbi:beta-lactamase superfamily domain-containing protein [Halteromyces radiatus]|uniref:beta-lactamase superfamily domain-containing protein n=1 Tax=Halteromyces radiatus TaxID=101107 RepID=UPI00221EF1B7|nr:beta-lactamase superfamily domain-containing protein [Halteromyces radiatus]KAI8082803.1 beta-lactamase superfamily domain-containing protein [Halteromyces radiatus]
MTQLTNINKRPSLLSFPIPFDHPFTIPTLIATLSASALLYYYLQATHAAELVEALRKKDIKKRKQLKRPEDRFASLKVEKRFVNPFEEWQEVPFLETALFWLRRWKGNGLPKAQHELEELLPVQLPALDTIFASRIRTKSLIQHEHTDNDEHYWSDSPNMPTTTTIQQSSAVEPVTFTWFGQSTCLITIDGLAILTDPVFTRCSINDYLGPKRLRPIPCKLEDFQENLDIVLVSHDHFDHLDEKVVYQLGNSVTWYIPLGLQDWFLKRKVTNVVELDWWQEIRHHSRPDIMIACVPAMHWSGSRTPFEKNGTLWCSYAIKGQNNNGVFFCGDTGYSSELFKAIGDIYAPFTLAAIPIGSFQPESMMQHVHMGPDDAIKVHEDLKMPRLSVGIHWGTFMMSDEHYLEPPRALTRLWQKRQQQGLLNLERHDDDDAQRSSSRQPSTHTNIDEESTSSSPTFGGSDVQSIGSSSSSSTISSSMAMNTDDKTTGLYSSRFITTAFGETVIID